MVGSDPSGDRRHLLPTYVVGNITSPRRQSAKQMEDLAESNTLKIGCSVGKLSLPVHHMGSFCRAISVGIMAPILTP